jgi:hypothetical protein
VCRFRFDGEAARLSHQNARKRGLFTEEAIAERKQIRVVLDEALLKETK